MLAAVARGLSNTEIADTLFMSPATAKTHVSRLLTKLDARDRAQLVMLAYEAGVVAPGHDFLTSWRGVSASPQLRHRQHRCRTTGCEGEPACRPSAGASAWCYRSTGYFPHLTVRAKGAFGGGACAVRACRMEGRRAVARSLPG